ncbi:hypothetical protein PPYR_07978 [Photinus pyralis]|uniref:Uncharacterized protein n=1 Tax=Photinus pyralis TaxID=7054 RepID=A0A1Y1K5U0_PHOPY|nr:nucleoporin Nup37 [Photinus pyralis]KAB0800098.1 hypothetical protein PPYR_07978 [Photinus pyralis]
MFALSSEKVSGSEPNYVINFEEAGLISVIHFSPYESSQDLLLIAFPTKILVTQLIIQDNVSLKELAQLHNGVTCTALALSSETSISTLPCNVVFCVAGDDYKIRVFKSDLALDSSTKILSGHSDYINDISYDPEGNYLASVSDDNTVKVWNTDNYKCEATLFLTSPGTAVCWHREDASKLMVAEKIGLIRFYNVNTQKPILSLEFGKPLSAAHWSPSDSQVICSLHLGELVVWDLSHPSLPTNSKLLHTADGGYLKINATGELVAFVNRLEGYVKVAMVNSQQQRLCASLDLPTSLTWHFRLPLLCVANDNKLCFWKVSNK